MIPLVETKNQVTQNSFNNVPEITYRQVLSSLTSSAFIHRCNLNEIGISVVYF